MRKARANPGKYVVDAVSKALDILDVFDRADGLSLVEIRQRVGLDKTRVFRLLQSLADRGYVERAPDGRHYRLGTKLLERAAFAQRSLKDVARRSMLQLQERFNETVNLGVLSDGHVLYVDIVESSRPFRMVASIGYRAPAVQTAMGKAILAALSPAPTSLVASTALSAGPDEPLPRITSRELAMIRERGYSIDEEENEAGVGCIGTPILDVTGQPVAAMSISGPVRRILSNEKEISTALVDACRGISQALGNGKQPQLMQGTTTARRTRSADVA